VTSLTYEIVDVFTDRPFTGNPLAVVFGADALGTDQLQALAREFNLAETVFPLPPTQPGATYRVRIFTPRRELPFAGHPSVGVAAMVVRRGFAGAVPGEVVQECGAGLLPIVVSGDTARLSGAEPTVGPELDPVPLLETVGLTPADFAGPAPRAASCGLAWTFLPVRPDAVARIELDLAAAKRNGVGMLSVFSWDPESRVAHTRAFPSEVGVLEDPATGSAGLAFGVWLVASKLLPPDGESAYTIRQGIEMHQPSVLEGTVTAVDGKAVATTITGHVVPVARGEIAIPPFVG
jgi:trans-2,3-dihydro-3-hydroxyanthranilate isomerase